MIDPDQQSINCKKIGRRKLPHRGKVLVHYVLGAIMVPQNLREKNVAAHCHKFLHFTLETQVFETK